MHQSVAISLLGFLALILYRIVASITTRIQNASKARQLHCQPAPVAPNLGFLGIKNIRKLIKADKEGTVPFVWIDQMKTMSEAVGRPCGTFVASVLGTPIYATSDPKNIQAILATQFQDFELGDVRRQIMGGVLGDGIFVQDGKPWEHSRAMLRPNFVRDQVSDLELEEVHVQELLQVVPVRENGWTDLTDIQTLFFRLTIDASTEFLFGESCGSQLGEAYTAANDTDNFSKNFDGAQMTMATKFRLDTWHWLYQPRGYKEQGRKVKEFAQRYVDRALQEGVVKKEVEPGQKERYVFLDALLKQTRDPEELRAQLLNILLAGRDTTAGLLSWTFDQLLRHPEVFDKLRSTIIETFGTYDNPRDITFATLKGCQYLQHTINEVLRLWTVVPGNGRRCVRDTTLPRGGGPDGLSPVFLPKGTPVEYSIHVMHRRKDLWGEDAEEFRPERWQGRRPGWEYLPFNGGPRICIGQQFALTEASYVIVRLLQRFDKIEAAPGLLDGPILSNLTLTSSPGRPVTMWLHAAAN